MNVAWFSPFPPVRSGISAYSAELLPHLGPSFVIDPYPESAAHDFVWRMRRRPYDLVVYQLGNAPCHDYMWAYLARYPGLVVLHDARLHHARARQLLQQGRHEDYRREFAYDHPDVDVAVAQYAIEGMAGAIYYFWPMVRAVVRAARGVAVHNAHVAAELREAFPDVPIDVIRMGVPSPSVDAPASSPSVDASRVSSPSGARGVSSPSVEAVHAPRSVDSSRMSPSVDTIRVPPQPVDSTTRAAIRGAHAIPDDAVVFAAFGKVTAEKRIPAILKALGALAASGRDVYVLLVGDADDYATLRDDLARHGVADRVRGTGWIADEAIGDYLAAADACLCLRWPTAQESSASWLRCLAAGRATVISDLAHTVDVPANVALRVDLLDENASLLAAMRALADDRSLRESLGRAGREHWATNHTLDAMAEDYRRVLTAAAASPVPQPTDLPSHFTDDYSARAREIVASFGLSFDL